MTAHHMSFVEDGEEGDASGTLTCQLPPKELNPVSFTLSCTTGEFNLYAMEYLGASVNIMPKSIFEHLKLASLKETSMVVEMADMKKGPIRDREPNETMIQGRPFLAATHAQIDVFKTKISLGIGEDRIKFDLVGGISHSRIPVEKIYMASSLHDEDYFNPFEIENDVFSYESHACLLFEQLTQSFEKIIVDTLESTDSIQGLKDNHEDVYPYPYFPNKIEDKPKPWELSFNDDKTPRDREITSQNKFCQEHPISDIKTYFLDFSRTQPTKPRPRDYSYKEWLKLKLGHTNVSKSVQNVVLNEWVLDSFNIETDYGKTCDDPYSRKFDEYKKVFDNDIEQLGNKYDLRFGKKRYALDNVWEKCKKFHKDTVYPWHDERFEEEEQWESGIEKTNYEPPFVKIKTFEIKRYSFKRGRSFVCITKQLDGALPLGRVNGSKFMGMIKKEMDEDEKAQRKT
ncbi:hypothetical protein Tco_0186062 [Tanacetum coccineum]